MSRESDIHRAASDKIYANYTWAERHKFGRALRMYLDRVLSGDTLSADELEAARQTYCKYAYASAIRNTELAYIADPTKPYLDPWPVPSSFNSTLLPTIYSAGLATVSRTGSYLSLTDRPTIPTNNNQLTNGAGYPTGIDSAAVTTALGFTPYSNTNPSSFVTQSGARSAISLTTTGSGAASYNSSTGVFNFPTPSFSGVTSVGLTSTTLTVTGSPITSTGSFTADLPTVGTPGTYSSVTTDNRGRVTAGTTRTFVTPSRTIVNSTSATGFQLGDGIRDTFVAYNGKMTTVTQALVLSAGNSEVQMLLETAATNSTSPTAWTTIARQNIALGLAITSTDGEPWSLSRIVPAGRFARIRSEVIAGTGATFSIHAAQQEVSL